MDESEILGQLTRELRLDKWYHDLIGQEPSFNDFDPDLAEQALPRTELVSAEVIKKKLGNHLSYTEASGVWYIWDGRIHTPCDGDGIAAKIVKLYYKQVREALEFIKEAIDGLAGKMAASGVDKAEDKAKAIAKKYDFQFGKHRKFRDRISTESGVSAIVKSLRTECDVPGTYFDNDQQWFVTRNWVFDLNEMRKGNFSALPHDPKRPVTKYFDASYDIDTNLGHWDKFIQTSIPNKEMREYLQKVVGAAFMGESKLRCIPNLYGPPHSGKSVFIGALFKLGKGGAGYSAAPDSRAVTKVSGQNFEQDTFKGRRFIGISEPSHTESIDDDFLKRFTGDDWVETRTLNVKSTGWVPQGVVFVASNKALKINTRDKAIVNRVQLIEFPVVFEKDHPEEDKRLITGLEDLLQEDRSRILTWIMIGMRKYVEDGRKLSPPEEVLAKSGEIVTDASTALRWVEEYVEDGLLEVDYTAGDKYYISANDAYLRYTMWASMSGERKPLTKRFFLQDIENKYGERVKGKDNVSKLIGLKPTVEYRRRFEATASDTSNGMF